MLPLKVRQSCIGTEMSVEFKVGARRRIMSWPVFGLTLGALIAGTGAAQAAGPVLPTGGKVVSGSAAIGAPGTAL